MSEKAPSGRAAVGFRVKSGRAIAVLVAGSVESPCVLHRQAIDLCDPAIPESRQPYHAGMGRLETDETKLKRLRKVVMRAAHASVTELIMRYRNDGHRVHAVALVVGSEIDPVRVTNPHIRAHAFEGQLFRTAVEDAVRSLDLPCSVVLERSLSTRASQVLNRSQDDLKRRLADFGRTLGKPWRADEKTASLAAWLILA
jgi:hypothetical protein